MANDLRTVNWIGVWEQCQETQRAHGFKGNGKRPGKGPSQMFSSGSSSEDTAIPSSYHLLTPKKREPKEDKKKSDSTAGNSTAQKYIHHLESVQAQLNLNDAPKESSRRGEKAKKDKEAERRKFRTKSGPPTSSKAINLQESVVSADAFLDVVFGQVATVDVAASRGATANGASAEEVAAVGAASNEAAMEEESPGELLNDSKSGNNLTLMDVRDKGAENETSEQRVGDEDQDEDCLERSNSLLTLRPVPEQIELETVFTDKDTQVAFCSFHNTFLKLKTDENEHIMRGEQMKEDEGKPALKRKIGLEYEAGRPKTALKRKMGLLAASLGNIILKKQRKAVDEDR